MNTEISELLGSQLGAVEKEYGSTFVKRIKRLLKKTKRKQQNLNIIIAVLGSGNQIGEQISNVINPINDGNNGI